MEKALADLKEAQRILEGVIDRKCYTIKEMKELRTLLLSTVRNNIDGYALGHAPDKRHY